MNALHQTTSLGIVLAQTMTYPPAVAKTKSCSSLAGTMETHLHTVFKHIQVLDKKRENDAIHR